MKSIVVQFTFPNLGANIYEGIVKDLEEAGMGNIPERLYHVAAQNGSDWNVTDVWESEEAFKKFSDVLIPIHIKNGGQPVEPLVLPVHNIIVPD